MKKTLTLIFAALMASLAQAQTIHWLTFVDTTDPSVGKIDVNGHEVLYDNFVNEVNAALADRGYSEDVQDFTGVQVSPENCRSAVSLLRVEPEDIVVFYYIGHGGRPNTTADHIEKHPYPQLYLAQHDGTKCIPLEWINNTLKEKGARLTVTIGMACNVLDNNITVKNGPAFAANYGVSNMSGSKMARIQEMFLNYRGNVIATSALPTQSSIGAETIFGPMDYYSAAISKVFKSQLDSWGGELTWESFLDTVGEMVDDASDSQQTPFYETHLTKVPMPAQTTPTTTAPPTPAEVQEDWSVLANRLTDLANASLGAERRMGMEQSLGQLFAPDAVVRILSHDGSVVIDREPADVFLGRVATSRLLLKISVVDGKLAGGKIKTLKVKETYREKQK